MLARIPLRMLLLAGMLVVMATAVGTGVFKGYQNSAQVEERIERTRAKVEENTALLHRLQENDRQINQQLTEHYQRVEHRDQEIQTLKKEVQALQSGQPPNEGP